jgi:predicted ester cyclase
MSEKKEDLDGYFTVKPEKFAQLVHTANRNYFMVADHLQDSVIGSEIKDWTDSAIPLLAHTLASLHDLRWELDEIVNNPPKDVTKMAKKHNIQGILIKGDKLLFLNNSLLEVEKLQKRLEDEHKLSFSIN